MTKTKTVYQYRKQYINNKGFSLVEMLMALLAASLLMAALVPVMTKKMHDNLNITVNGSNQSKGWRLYTYSSDCTKAESEDNVCEFNDFKVPKDVYSINLVMVSGGGGGAGAAAETLSDPVTITKTAEGIKTDEKQYDEQIIPVTKYMTDVKIAVLVGAGGGGGGGSVAQAFIPSSSNCAGYGTGKTDTAGNTGNNFATYDALGICMTKFNQKAPSGCWTGYVHSGGSKTCSSSGAMAYVYSGCGRTLCTQPSSVIACSNLAASTGDGWRLPVHNEMAKWNTSAFWKQLAFCDRDIGTVISRCNNSEAILAANNQGGAYFIHGDNTHSALHSSIYDAGSGVQIASSVRCVYDGIYVLSGAGGSSGNVISNINLTEYINSAGGGGQIVLRAGRGGAGGNNASAKNSSALNGENGYRSCIYVQKKPVTGTYGDTVYAVCAYEGQGGQTGDISAVTAASVTEANSYCREYKNGLWKDIECTIAGKSGEKGTKVSGPDKIRAKGGNGGNSSYNSTGGGIGAKIDSTDTNGSDGTFSGAGGGGGSAIYHSYENAVKTGKGGNGAGGIAEITYKNEFKGAGGGGGAGGTFAKLTNLSISNDTECVIKVGGGGNYGSGQNGKDGGNTSIKCGNSKEYIVFGGKGGKLGTSGKDINNPEPVGGKAGDTGKVSENIIQLGTLAKIIYGEGMGNNIAEETALKINAYLNIGGNGGKSGTNATGGCGGLRPDSDPDCTNPNQNAAQAEYITPLYSSLIQEAPDYGKAGAGGGGGGWSKNLSPKQGTGSQGQPGYLFLWWDQTAE